MAQTTTPTISTPAEWAAAQLTYMGLPTSASNLAFLTGWYTAEGGNWHNTATYNPLNTTLQLPGSSAIAGNSAGVQAYTSWGQGLQATASTLQGYPAIYSALKSGNASSADTSGQLGADFLRWSGGGYSQVPVTPLTAADTSSISSILGLGASGITALFGGGSKLVHGAESTLSGIDAVGTFFSSLTKGVTWIRMLEVVAGIGLMAFGLWSLVKIVSPELGAAEQRAVSTLKRTATTAATAAAL